MEGQRCSRMYTPDYNEARHMISGYGALLEPCLPNAFNTLSHLTLSGASERGRVSKFLLIFCVHVCWYACERERESVKINIFNKTCTTTRNEVRVHIFNPVRDQCLNCMFMSENRGKSTGL